MARSIFVKLLCLSLFILSITSTFADEYRPAYLEIKQTSPDVFNMLWKVPAKGTNQRLALYVNLPEDTTVIGTERSSFVGGAFISRSIVKRSGGFTGALITIDGLKKVSTDVLVRIHLLDGTTQVVRLSSSETSFTVASAPTTVDVAQTYIFFGFEHILEGIDHLLFVACLVFIAGTWKRILITITGFTVAHSITLSMAALNIVSLPVLAVEAVIALSMVFLAREIVHHRRDTLTWRYPVLVSATFGLLHGFGFASALIDIGLPQNEIPTALLSFNIGVEIGQIAFVVALISVGWVIKRTYRAVGGNKNISMTISNTIIEKPIAYGIGSITMLWTLERLSVFWV